MYLLLGKNLMKMTISPKIASTKISMNILSKKPDTATLFSDLSLFVSSKVLSIFSSYLLEIVFMTSSSYLN